MLIIPIYYRQLTEAGTCKFFLTTFDEESYNWSSIYPIAALWRDGRAAEGTSLLRTRRGNPTEGSNPSLSAIPHLNYRDF